MNFASTKERILQYIDYKGITNKIFFENTGIKRGFLDGDKLKAIVSDVSLAKIVETYKEINPDWLLTGEGEMLRQSVPVSEDLLEKLTAQEKVIKDKEKIIEGLEFKIATLEKENGRHDQYESIELEAIATRTKPKLEKEK